MNNAEHEALGISFHAEDVVFELNNPSKTKLWIEKIIAQEGASLGTISYVFCSDEYLLNINQQYLQHDTYTDIITFPYNDEPLEGDLFISIDRVKDNAQQLNLPFQEELHRVIIHGILHLLGYDDLTDEGEQAMRDKENACLSIFHALI